MKLRLFIVLQILGQIESKIPLKKNELNKFSKGANLQRSNDKYYTFIIFAITIHLLRMLLIPNNEKSLFESVQLDQSLIDVNESIINGINPYQSVE